jgi:hypothetical protein
LTLPPRTDPCWQNRVWRTEALRSLMDEHGLTAAMVADILDCSELTVFGYRSITARPISANTLKALVYEIERESLV